MKNIMYANKNGLTIHPLEAWSVETEDIYIHTQKKRHEYGIPTIREALPYASPYAGSICFKIKVWGRAGWNS